MFHYKEESPRDDRKKIKKIIIETPGMKYLRFTDLSIREFDWILGLSISVCFGGGLGKGSWMQLGFVKVNRK